MKKIVKILAVFVVVMGFATLWTTQTEAKESKDYVIKVNLGTNCVTIYKDNKPVKAMISSPSTETPIGTFYTPVKYKWHEMIGNCYAQYCTRITGNILFHSVWYYKNGDKSTMSVAAYNVMGNKASHGCVRLLCKDAKWIYDNCTLGTKVVIFKGTKKDDPLGRPSFNPIKTGAFTSWDPTDPDPKNPYQKAKPTIAAKKLKLEYNSKIKAKSAVTIKDSLGNTITSKNGKIKIKGRLNTKKLGKQKIKYTVKDERGNKQIKTITFRIVDTKKPKLYGVKKKSNIAAGETRDVLSGVTAKMVSGKDITSKITVKVVRDDTGKKVKHINGKAVFTSAGTYTVTYTVKGTNKKTSKKSVKYNVIDKHVAAVMTGARTTIAYRSDFNPLAYVKSITTYDGKALGINNNNVTVSGTVNTLKPGSYELLYTFSNAGNEYTRITIKITIVVKTPPAEETTTAPEKNTEEAVTGEEETTTNTEEKTDDSEENTTVSNEEITTVA